MRAEYLLIISPSTSVRDVVLYLKKQLGNKINDYPGRYSQPHISILWVELDDSLEHQLFSSLFKILALESPIVLTTNGIKYFPSSKTIYLGIEETSSFEQMSRNIGKSSFIVGLPAEFRSSTYVPHLTINRNLEHSFDFARDYFGEYSYKESFTASSALLLKRYDGGRYFPVQEFPFCAVLSGQLPMFTPPIYV
ncbi:2'-5' RNA ligase family protein [Adhaeribacter rhizoryzae]|uniref:2'-5' RNA ligase family protein n=1 Tax=Adhaeribacter rhizoryzae TaxID=2607907 RepID=A0A5M6DN28_9BACT|nr:2'-5' RNA ligase family protein [Adhaeribacter rhizoryzae]KAA5548813.1 2'-5' RNA ligase family protein [Adhaeribacter rhizoryzae]